MHMLPPVLEIYVVWHPDDSAGGDAAQEIIDHFHGTASSGLIGGAVEVYVRCEGWAGPQDAPRPLPCVEAPPAGIEPAELTAIVPVLGEGLAAAVEPGSGPWHEYVEAMLAAQRGAPDNVGVFPLAVRPAALDGTELGRLLGDFEQIGTAQDLASEQPPAAADEDPAAARCRNLAQRLARLASGHDDNRLTVLVSHAGSGARAEILDAGDELLGYGDEPLGHGDGSEGRGIGDEPRGDRDSAEPLSAGDEPEPRGDADDTPAPPVERVRQIIARAGLGEQLEARDLGQSADWPADLSRHAATGVLLAIRTDLYSTRERCQHEMLLAKRAGMPIAILDALVAGEHRGSFLMDHVARIPSAGGDGDGGLDADGGTDGDAGLDARAILRALSQLVDESLERALWARQERLARERSGLEISWWAPHAPEPSTFARWLSDAGWNDELPESGPLRVLHADPPLGSDEVSVLDDIVAVAGLEYALDVLTPREVAARGG